MTADVTLYLSYTYPVTAHVTLHSIMCLSSDCTGDTTLSYAYPMTVNMTTYSFIFLFYGCSRVTKHYRAMFVSIILIIT